MLFFPTLAGESLAFQYYRAEGGSGLVSFAGVLPGEMRALELDGTRGWMAEKDAFVAAEASVDFDIAFSGLRTGTHTGYDRLTIDFSNGGPSGAVELKPQSGTTFTQSPSGMTVRPVASITASFSSAFIVQTE